MRVSVCLGAILIPEYPDFDSGYFAPNSGIYYHSGKSETNAPLACQADKQLLLQMEYLTNRSGRPTEKGLSVYLAICYEKSLRDLECLYVC